MSNDAPLSTSDPSFERLRPRLQGIAYRMLGSRADAEDVVQDVWLRWNAADRETLANAVPAMRRLLAELERWNEPRANGTAGARGNRKS